MHQEVKGLLTRWEFDQSKYKPMIPFEALDIDKKHIAYWRREGLMPFIEKGKNAKLSFIQCIWVMVLDTMRKFKLPLETLKAVTAYFLTRAYEDDLPKRTLQYNYDRLQALSMERPLTPDEGYLLAEVNFSLARKLYLQGYQWDVNYFAFLITDALEGEKEAAVLIFEDGTIGEYLHPHYSTFPEKEIGPNQPHIYIPLQPYLKQFIQSEELAPFLGRTLELNEDEERVIREMRNQNIREIVIYNKANGTHRIESSKAGVITTEQAAYIRRTLGLHNYERITIETLDEKSLSFKKTRKR